MASEAYFTTWHIVYVAIIVPTVFGNGLILYSVAKFPRLRSNMHILIANLAVSDFIVGTILVPFDLLADVFGWKSNKHACLFVLGAFVLSLGTSCYNLLLISIERFLAISFPLRARTILTTQKMIFMISLGWIIVTVNSSIPFYGVNTFMNSSECAHNVVWPKAYQTNCDWQLITALLLNFVFYTVVVHIAMRKSRVRSHMDGHENFSVHRTAKRDMHQLLTMVIVLGTFMVCWLLYIVLSFIVTFWDTAVFQFIKRCTLILGLFNSAMNWIIYGYRNREFSMAFKSVLRCKTIRDVDTRPTRFSSNIYTTDHVM